MLPLHALCRDQVNYLQIKMRMQMHVHIVPQMMSGLRTEADVNKQISRVGGNLEKNHGGEAG